MIDIGSNSVRMMLQGSADKYSVTTRLGTGLAQSGRLDPSRAKQSAVVTARFANQARKLGCTPLAYATSAVRDAENRGEFLELVKLTSGIDIDVLSGEREAKYAHAAVCGDRGGGLIDIGGASMQFVSDNFARSFPVGCVRGKDIATELTAHLDPPDDYRAQREALCGCVDKLVAPYIEVLKGESFAPCFGVGGTITTLCALNVDREAQTKLAGDGKSMSRAELEELIDHLHALGGLRARVGVLAARHDVILYGAALLSKAMELLGLDSITASLRDGLDGYLESAIRGELGV